MCVGGEFQPDGGAFSEIDRAMTEVLRASFMRIIAHLLGEVAECSAATCGSLPPHAGKGMPTQCCGLMVNTPAMMLPETRSADPSTSAPVSGRPNHESRMTLPRTCVESGSAL